MNKLPSSKLDVKLIALDLDDTLLNGECHISERTVRALQAAADQGIYIVLCSGRAENGILPFVHMLDIAGKQTGRYLIAFNGALIFDLHTRLPFYENKVDPKYKTEICKKFQSTGKCPYGEKCIFFSFLS